jgi:polyisoprenoid-binding protein YceI
MTAAKWTLDTNQSDVLFKTKHSIIAYLTSTINKFRGSINVIDDQLEDASIEFCVDVNSKEGKLEQIETHLKLNDFFDTKEYPIISFRSTSFQKVNANINFLKGDLTINNVTKVVELDATLIGLETYNGVSKAIFEIIGKINRKDFGLRFNSYTETLGLVMGQDINLIANVEFTNQGNA